jgi:hypothetical protein
VAKADSSSSAGEGLRAIEGLSVGLAHHFEGVSFRARLNSAVAERFSSSVSDPPWR